MATRSIYNHRNRAVLEDDTNVSRRLRDLEFKSISSYEKPELVPIEKKDTVAVFTLTKYINDLEKNLTDLAVGLEPKIQQLIASISDNPLSVAVVPPIIKEGLYIPKKPKPIRGVVGSGITEQSIITRILSSWNAFTTYMKNFKDVNTMSRSDNDELYGMLENLQPIITKIINDILIIENNDPTQKFTYEKLVLEKIDEKINDRNLTKIEISEITPTYKVVISNENELKTKAVEYKDEFDKLQNFELLQQQQLKDEAELQKLEGELKVWQDASKQQQIDRRTAEIDKRNQENADKTARNAVLQSQGITTGLETLDPVIQPLKNVRAVTFNKWDDKIRLQRLKELRKIVKNTAKTINALKPPTQAQVDKLGQEFDVIRKRLKGGEDFRQEMIRKEEIRKRGIVPEKKIHFYSDLDDFYKD